MVHCACNRMYCASNRLYCACNRLGGWSFLRLWWLLLGLMGEPPELSIVFEA